MQFRVLGPLDVRSRDGGTVELGAAKQRTLLACLLLRPNRPVPVDQLVEILWPEAVPRSARAIVRTYISALRGVLGLTGTPGGPRLVSSRGGYQLFIESAELDLLVFEELSGAGLRALADGNPAIAVERLRRALGLWRGRPLENVTLDGELENEVARLEERQLEVLESCVEARLAVGDHAGLTTELSKLAAEHPLRERLQGQWMLALYRSGRQSEALQVFRGLRERLRDELGVEPSPPVQLLHRQILAGDPALSPPVAGAVATSPNGHITPCQLPPEMVSFVGRPAEVSLVRSELTGRRTRGPAAIVAIDGTPGIGKSALALHVAHEVATEFPDGQLYARLQVAGQPVAPVVVLGQFLRALGLPGAEVPATEDEAAVRFRALTATRRLLVVLDDARSAAQVRSLVPAGQGTALLVTSRQTLAALDGARCVHLDALARDEAVTLLAGFAGRRVADDRAEAERVVALCGYLPLAVRIAGGRLAARPHWSVRRLADRLTDQRHRLDELELDDLRVRASFEVSLRALREPDDATDQAAAAAFGLVGLPDGPDIGLGCAARLLDLPEKETEQILERLLDAKLVDSTAPGRYRLHDLLRLYAREQAAAERPADERDAALLRAYAWYASMAWQTFRLLRPGDQRPLRAAPRWAVPPDDAPTTADAALEWLEAERGNLVAAVRQAAAGGGDLARAATELAQALFGFFLMRGYWHEWLEVNETALAAAQRTGDHAAEAHACRDLGTVHELRGEYDEALRWMGLALAGFERLGDRYGQATSLHGLGVVYYRQGRYDDAADRYRDSVAIRRDMSDHYGLAVGLTNLGLVHGLRKRYSEALTSHSAALAVFERLGDKHGQAITLTAIGEAYHRQGRYAEALAYHEDSLAMLRVTGNRIGQVSALNNLGLVHQGMGAYARAVTCHEEALAIVRDSGERYEQGECWQLLGSALQALGRSERARSCWQQAAAIFEDLDVPAAAEVRALLAGLPANGALRAVG